MVHAAVTVMAGLALTMATAAAPALAAPHRGGPAASHPRPATSGQHIMASRMNHGPQWAHIGLGADHNCATHASGTLWCWGLNGSGQLGIGNHTGQDRPRQVTTPAAGGWASVTAGYSHTCATRTAAPAPGQARATTARDGGQDGRRPSAAHYRALSRQRYRQ